ncbi:MAG TPA: biopolymer transporter ExbD [Parasegetibacter sp.]|jgi:biopolymer transport protein ExbD
MADIDVSDGGGHKKGPGVKKSKKKNARVDLTAMVDLGFLLITFFIFTTTLQQPMAMQLLLPKDTDRPEEQNKTKETGAFTILLGADDRVYYYEYMDPTAMQVTTFGKIRDLIIDKKRRTPKDDLVLILKPSDDATFKNTVDIVDEMTINDISRFAMVDITPEEYEIMKSKANLPVQE